MSDNKREQERTELYRTIWALANELRGSVDGWDFKQYVLGMLFYRWHFYYRYSYTLSCILVPPCSIINTRQYWNKYHTLRRQA